MRGLLIIVLIFPIFQGCSVLSQSRQYEAASSEYSDSSVWGRNCAQIPLAEVELSVCSPNLSVRPISGGPWFLSVIPMPFGESLSQENLKLEVYFKLTDNDVSIQMDVSKVKIILEDGKQLIPKEYFINTVSTNNSAIHISDSLEVKEGVKSILIVFNETKKGVTKFKVLMAGASKAFSDRINDINFEETRRMRFEYGP